MFFIFLITALLCYWCGVVYISNRLQQAAGNSPATLRKSISLLSIIVGIMPFILFALRYTRIPDHAYSNIFNGFCVLMILVFYMSLAMLLLDGMKRFLFPNLKYRVLYAALFATTLLAKGYNNHMHPQINRIGIATEKVVAGDTLTIVAASDFHLGYATGKGRLKELVDIINAENPDIILIAGDLIDNSLKPLYEENMHEELNQLRAPLGIFMAPGNHEYISGIEESRRFLERTGIHLIADSSIKAGKGVEIICRDDASNRGRLPLEILAARAGSGNFTILVDHQPREISIKDSLGIDLQISGHTHNGQVWPGNIIVDQLFEQSNGYRKWYHSHVYVSSGLSLWGPPIRIGTKGDIGVFNIYSTNKDSIRK